MSEKAKKALERQQSITAAAKAESRDFTDAERAEFDTLQRTIEEERSHAEPAVSKEGDAATRAMTAERERITSISALCRDFDVDPTKFISDGDTVDSTRAAVLEQLKVSGAPAFVRTTRDDGDNFREAASDALMMKMGQTPETPARGAEEMRSMGLRDIAIECLAREGESTGSLIRMAPATLYDTLCRSFYNPTAAFPAILDASIKKSIEHSYKTTPTTFERFTTKGSLSDFKDSKDHSYAIGGVGDMPMVPENGELIASVPRTELLPNRKLETHGTSFSMSRQAFINDDIGFISEIPAIYAASAKRTINKNVYKILLKNPIIFDGTPFFSTEHKNLLAAGTAPTDAVIQTMIQVLGNQRDQFGDSIMVPPSTIVLPLGYGFAIRSILNSQTISTAGNTQAANPLYGLNVDIVEDAALNVLAGKDAAPWFITGDPSAARGIQVDYLNGQETPTIRRAEKPGTLGFVWDIYLDWGIAVRDFRGIVKNPGVVIVDPLA